MSESPDYTYELMFDSWTVLGLPKSYLTRELTSIPVILPRTKRILFDIFLACCRNIARLVNVSFSFEKKKKRNFF